MQPSARAIAIALAELSGTTSFSVRTLDLSFSAIRLQQNASRRSGSLRWSRKTGQGFKVGSPLMKDGSDDWQTEALLG